jgi:hypothetical protein
MICKSFDGLRYCLPACTTGCPDHFACHTDACVPDCLSGWPCPAGEVCTVHGTCRKTSPGPGPGGR